jgi:type I site-specific restriction-modification system R (restriction) subunit
VIVLKNSRVSIGDGIRQLLSNQRKEFNAWFFATVQIVFAGSDSEGLKYGTIGTEEKYFLRWKEDEADDSRFKMDKYLLKLCRKDRLIELMHDFVVFDAGTKKLPRVHQYFGIKAAQEHVRRRQGGIIWHTQGSGKSIVMVLLAKWILENNPNARVGIITDRDELDKQIERVFTAVGEPIKRTSSGRELMRQLGQARPRLLCSLVHKFGRKDVDDFETFIKELIRARREKAIDYEAYLTRIAELATRVQAGHADEIPKTLNTPGKRALYNNLDHNEELALRIDEAVKRIRPDSWRDVQAREQVIKAELYRVLQDVGEVERIFMIIKAQTEY